MFRGMDAVTGLVTAVALASASLADRRATVFRLEGITVLDDLGRVWVYAVALVGPYLFTLSRNTASGAPDPGWPSASWASCWSSTSSTRSCSRSCRR